MKNLMMILTLGFSAMIVSACGDNKSNQQTAAATAANTCSIGMVSTAYGCLPQGNCSTGMAMYNGSCIQGTMSNPTNAMYCSAGQVQTQYGCVVQGNCPVGQGFYNNSCVPAINTGYNTGYNNGSNCAVGQVQTQYGCVVQGNCPVGSGFYNNSCVPATNTGYNTGYNNGGNYYNPNTGYGNGQYYNPNTGYNNQQQGPCMTGYVFYNGMCYRTQNNGAGFQFNWGFGF